MRVLFLNPQASINKDLGYLGKHPDFGGQLVYVLELAKAMAKQGIKSDIITRQLIDTNWSGFESPIDSYYNGTLRIIRLPFGGLKFLRKELLWGHLNEYVKNIYLFYKKENLKFNFITSHYADGGIAAAILSNKTNIGYSFTAHSLGAQKLKTLGVNMDNFNQLNTEYNLVSRIIAERISMSNSLVNITSTSHERFQQYGHPLYNDIIDAYDNDKFSIIPPGINTKIFNTSIRENEENTISEIKSCISRDIRDLRKKFPYILAVSRLDSKKNHIGLVKAYAQNEKLQKTSNLMIQVRGLDNPIKNYMYTKDEFRETLESIINYISKYNLAGKVCFVNLKNQYEIATCYRYVSKFKSIFCLPAYHEPFGFAPLEAVSCGLPVVVTKIGGPSEVFVQDGNAFGLLVDPYDIDDLSKKLLQLLENSKLWKHYHDCGLDNISKKYTWEICAKTHINIISKKISEKHPHTRKMDIPAYFLLGTQKEKPSIESIKRLMTYLKAKNYNNYDM